MNQPTALERFLSRLRLRSELSDEEARAILALTGREVSHKARTVLLRPGQTVDFCCLVVDGLLCRFDDVARGRQITALYIPGDVADLHTLVMPKGEWGFEALAPSTTLRLPHDQLCEIAMRYPAISFAFWRDTVADATILSKWLGKLGLRQVTSRLAHLICELGLRLEQVGLGARTHFRVPLTQDQIADVLGITNVSVSNAFGELQREGVLDRTRSEIRIHDLARLTNIAEFDPSYLLVQKSAANERLGDQPAGVVDAVKRDEAAHARAL